ncbi:MAG TPA: methyltransferase domain-containing protein [Solirubrobacteraceae bacterium]|jgi:SAM-dependent methyltransferase|nr:methyltransferase domain-containing protein [Solirubrobacteraceae bacterium]
MATLDTTRFETSMADPNALENDLRSFYLTGSEEMSIYEEWEHGIARGDSTTPSISSPTYRWWILEHLRNALDRDRKNLLLSLGAGNAFVERVLGREGYPVLAVDALDEAVELARQAGVPAICQNLYTWDARPRYWDVVYADGLLGHLHDGNDGAHRALCRFYDWLKPTGGTVVISNDAPKTDEPVQQSANVPGFYWLSTGWIAAELKRAGFNRVSTATIVYRRPLTGPRSRAIITAHRTA